MKTGYLDGSRRTIRVMGEISATGARALLIGRGLEGAQALGQSVLARFAKRDPQACLRDLLDDPRPSPTRMGESFAIALRISLKPAFEARPQAYRLLVDPRRLTFRAVNRADAESLARQGLGWSFAGPDRGLAWRLP